MTKDTDRHSEPVETPEHQPLTPEERAPIEAANGLRQFDRLIQILEDHLRDADQGNYDKPLVVKPWILMELNRLAVERIIANPGGYRQSPMVIRKKSGAVKHQPPRWEDVPQLVDEMCDYANQNWHRSGIHLAAYLLWRVNWIHPFSDGNGRTARAISYLILCARLRQRLPGDRAIPDFVSDDKDPYYAGLETADEAWAKGKIDVAALEEYLSALLADQVKRAATMSNKATAPAPPPLSPKRDVDWMAEALGFANRAIDVATARKPESHKGVWIAGLFALVVAITGGLFAGSRCGKEARCVAGEQRDCACANGTRGIQACLDDGLKYDECKCARSTPDLGGGSVAPSSGDGATMAPTQMEGAVEAAGVVTPDSGP